ncbi:MAG TPA: alpha/beta hydrolase [Dehalococcoidia bacterium]|nr:alpha/beta hydrolase [Dehalococcoidia bacterium]
MANNENLNESLEVAWEVDSIPVPGTLIKPPGAGPFPAVVLVAGSGPTDRDWASPLLAGTNGAAPLLAEALAHAGFASLRYDKRPSGTHPPEYWPTLAGKLSMQSHVDELTGAVRTLAEQAFVRRDQIFGLGNSEGTLHVLHYQVQQPAIPFAGLVLAAPPGRSVGVVARSQLAPQAATLPNGDALLALYDAAIDRFLAEQPVAPDPALPQEVQVLLLSLGNPVNLPFARELWTADAASPLAEVDVPVLVIIGKKDLQVDWQADGEPLQRAAADRSNITFVFPENANHILKYEPQPREELTLPEVMQRYNVPDTTLDRDTVAALIDWMRSHLHS